MTREEVIERLKLILETDIITLNGFNTPHEPLEKEIEALKIAIKTLEQEPRKGHWIGQPSNKEQGERDFIWWKCSECGQVIFSETLHDRLEFHAFCGRCGADMREVEE